MKSLIANLIVLIHLPLIVPAAVIPYPCEACRTGLSQMENAKWLIGTWENRTSRGSTFETWIVLNDSAFYGKSYALRGQDTAVFETIRMIQKEDQILYIPTIPDQNEGKPVTFTSIYLSGNKLIFEAPEHDFPQVISYTRVSADEMVAEISGLLNGEQRYRTFKMNRYPPPQSMNVELARMVFEYFNAHDWEKMVSLYSDPAEFKDPSYGTDLVTKTRKEIVIKCEELLRMSPDIKDEIVAVYPSGDKHVIVEFISSGIDPDGSEWKLPLVTIFTIEGGMITKDFTYYDDY